MAEVVLDNISRAFSRDTIAVDQVKLAVQDGEFLVLVGPSGCGKSTTLRMIAGLEEVSSGEIRIGGRRVNEVSPRDRNIAMVFQNYALYPHMTVWKNMAFGLQLRYGGSLIARLWRRLMAPAKARAMAVHRREIESRVRSVAATLGIEALLDRLPRQLSGGERQRVALGRAIVREPAVFLFDEPLSNLDAKLRVEMRKEIRQLHQRLAATMVYVTHDQTEALTLGQRIAVMNQGRLQQVATPHEIYERPRNHFVAGFIGTPAMNLIEGKLDNLNRQANNINIWRERTTDHAPRPTPLVWQRGTLGVAPSPSDVGGLNQHAGSTVTLGIRPEDVRLDVQDGLPATVQLVEPLGDATLIHLELVDQQQPSATMVAKAAAGYSATVGSPQRLGLATDRLHWFDAQGERIADENESQPG